MQSFQEQIGEQQMQKLLFSLLIVLFPGWVCPTFAQTTSPWYQTKGPWGGYVMDMDTFGGYLWANTRDGGVYRSSNNAISWEEYNVGIRFTPLDATVSFCNANGRLFLATSAQGILRLDNPSGTWTSVLGGHFYQVVKQGSAIFAAKYEAPFIYKSTDNGTTWTPSSTGFTAPNYGNYGIAATPNYLLATYYKSGVGVVVYRSADGGATWAQATAPSIPGAYDLHKIRVVNGKIFVFYNTYSSSPDPMYTTDGGLTWSFLPNPTNLLDRIEDLAFTGTRYIGSNIYQLFNYAASFGVSPTIRPAIMSKYQRTNDGIFINGQAAYVMGDRLIKTDTAFQNFSFADSGMRAYPASFITGNGTRIITRTSKGSISATNDFGASWQTDSNLTEIVTATIRGAKGFLGGPNSGVSVSTDGGYHFNTINSGFASYANGTASVYPQTAALHTTAANEVLAGNGNLLYRLNANDTSWSLKYSFPTTGNPNLQSPAITAINSGGGFLFVGTQGAVGDGGLYRSADGGATWTTKSIDSLYKYVSSLAVFGNKLYLANTSHGMFRSDDWGDHWVSINSGLTSVYSNFPTVNSLSQIGSHLYCIVDYDQDLYQLDASSNSWTNLTPQPSDPAVKGCYGSGDSVLYVTTSNTGVWKRKMTLPSPSAISWQPAGATLAAALYPNPGGRPILKIENARVLPAQMSVISAATGQTISVRRLAEPQTAIDLNVPNGIYLIDVIGADGSNISIKWLKN